MSSLECNRCKSIFRDVIRVKKCPLCGNTEFAKMEPLVGLMQFPKWFTREGTIGYAYYQTMRIDEAASV